jgi:tRNA(fMet)-specific endonuclease VapC
MSVRRRTTARDLGFDDNDLWIAAIALVQGLTVVTSDGDFQRMSAAFALRIDSWLAPPA